LCVYQRNEGIDQPEEICSTDYRCSRKTSSGYAENFNRPHYYGSLRSIKKKQNKAFTTLTDKSVILVFLEVKQLIDLTS